MKIRSFLLCILFCQLLSSSCGVKVEESGSLFSSFIRGSVPSLKGLISKSSDLSLLPLTQAHASICGPDVVVNVHELNQDGQVDIDQSLYVTTLSSDATFTIPRSVLPKLNENEVHYVARVTGCDDRILMRPITASSSTDGAEDEVQEITYSSTLLTTSNISDIPKKLNDLQKHVVQQLLKDMGSGQESSELGVYGRFAQDVELKRKFQEIFGASPELLEEAAPKIDTIIPNNINEVQQATFRVIAHHWNPSYDTAYVWKLNGVTKSTLSNWSYVPSANEQGTHTVTLYVGKSNGGGALDLNKPYSIITKTLAINNNITPSPLEIALDTTQHSSSIVSSLDLHLKLDTGGSLSNCASFSKLALTESGLKPLSSNEFDIECTDNTSQDLLYTLSDSDGVKTLFLWAMDASGSVSSTPETLQVTLDRAAPIVSNLTIASRIKGGVAHPITWSISDVSAIIGRDLYYSTDQTTYNLIASDIGTNSYSWTAPVINDSVVTLRLSITDAAGNTTVTDSSVIEIDSTPPTLILSSPAASTTTQNALTLTGTCESSVGEVYVTGQIAANKNVSCDAGTYSVAITLSGSDGPKNVTISQSDLALNSSEIDVTFVKDNVAPTLTQTSLVNNYGATIVTNSDSITFGGACETGASIAISGADTGSATCNAATWTYTTQTQNTDDTYLYTFVHEDMAGNSMSLTHSWVRDTAGPSVTDLSLANGASNVSNNLVASSFSAADEHHVEKICLKYSVTTRPLNSDLCWRMVSAPPLNLTVDESISVSDFNYQLGVGAGPYNVYVWAMDGLGNVSELTNSGSGTEGVDKYTISYAPGTPPEITGLILSGTDTPSNPLSISEKTIAQGSDVYIKWKVFDNESLAANPINLYYTTDDVNFVLIQEDVLNSDINGCTIDHASSQIDDGFTGCFLWSGGSPVDSYYRILLKVKDSDNTTNTAFSNEVNSNRIQILAGNTSTGIGGPASTAILYSRSNLTRPDISSLVVADNGDVYIKDSVRGILKISQDTGIVDVFIPLLSSVSTSAWGDGVSVASAKVKAPLKMIYTFDNQILLWDYNVIRRIDLNASPVTIHNMIGGGSTNIDGGLPADEYLEVITSYPSQSINTSFFALPNGDILFQSKDFPDDADYHRLEDQRFRRFVASEQKIYDVALDVSGPSLMNASQDLGRCMYRALALGYDPINSSLAGGIAVVAARLASDGCVGSTDYDSGFMRINSDLQLVGPAPTNTVGHSSFGTYVTGQDGAVYRVNRDVGFIQKYNQSTGALENIVGSGFSGECVDGTPALECPIEAVDIFVNSSGRIYIFDGRRIRYVDQNSEMATIAGTSYSYGDNGPPHLARFGTLGYIGKTDNDNYIALDTTAFRFRSFTLNGTIQTIAGNGTNLNANETDEAQDQGFYVKGHDTITGFGLNKADGTIYYSYHREKMGKLNPVTKKWERLVGFGGYPWNMETADGQLGSDIHFNNPRAMGVYGFHNGHIIGGTYQWASYGAGYSMLKRWSITDGTQSHFLGKEGTALSAESDINLCSSGSALNACHIHRVQQGGSSNTYTQISYDSYDDLYLFGRWSSNRLYQVDLANNQFTKLPNLPRTIRNMTYVRNADKSVDILYYCAENGRLYKYDRNTSTETALPWSIPSVFCNGESLVYDSDKNSLVFVFTQNLLYGIAEYLLD